MVLNQTPPLADYNLFTTDRALEDAVRREGAARPSRAAGGRWRRDRQRGELRARRASRIAIRPCCKLRRPGRAHRCDRVSSFLARADARHRRARLSQRALGSASGGSREQAGAHVARAAGYLMQAQVECGTLCPTTMTYGAIAAMRRDPGLTKTGCRVCSRAIRPARHPHRHKLGGLIGMGMTEKQGGSDVRANTTRAARGADGSYRITGHKWFFSAPQCDAHLVLAQAEGGLSCFFMPRRLPDGSRNCILHPASQGQARQPLERLVGSRIHRTPGGSSWARKAAAFRPSWRWARTRVSTA